MPYDEAVAIIREKSGRHFDPAVVKQNLFNLEKLLLQFHNIICPDLAGKDLGVRIMLFNAQALCSEYQKSNPEAESVKRGC